VGNFPEDVTGERKFGLTLNMFADIAWNDVKLQATARLPLVELP
jgi:hypothetical protein